MLYVSGLGIWQTFPQVSGNGRGGHGEVFQVPPGPHASLPPFCEGFGSLGHPFEPMDIRGASAVCVCSMRRIPFRENELNVQTWVEEPGDCFLFFRGVSHSHRLALGIENAVIRVRDPVSCEMALRRTTTRRRFHSPRLEPQISGWQVGKIEDGDTNPSSQYGDRSDR